MNNQELNNLTKRIIKAAIEVHREMGPGLLESVYEICLLKELELMGINAESQVLLPLFYKEERLPKDFRIDLLVEDEIVIELKSVKNLTGIDQAQTISYLRLSEKRLGLLINFNVPLLKQGIKRFVNNFD